jgi:hypothetical protein
MKPWLLKPKPITPLSLKHRQKPKQQRPHLKPPLLPEWVRLLDLLRTQTLLLLPLLEVTLEREVMLAAVVVTLLEMQVLEPVTLLEKGLAE